MEDGYDDDLTEISEPGFEKFSYEGDESFHEEEQLIYEGDEKYLPDEISQDEVILTESCPASNHISVREQNVDSDENSQPFDEEVQVSQNVGINFYKAMKEMQIISNMYQSSAESIGLSNKSKIRAINAGGPGKHIAGLSFIIGLKGKGSGNKTTKPTFDCVLCNETPSTFNGLEMHSHVNSRNHALNVMELECTDIFLKMKNDNEITDEDLLKVINDFESEQKKQHLVAATSDSYSEVRKNVSKSIEVLKAKASVFRSVLEWEPDFQEKFFQQEYFEAITFLDKSFLCRSFKKIVIISNVSRTVESMKCSLPVTCSVAIPDLTLNNAYDHIKTQPDFNHSTLFLVCLTSLSLLEKLRHPDCIECKCRNPSFMFKYKEQNLVSEALLLAKLVVDSTQNDAVMFSGIIPIDFDSKIGYSFEEFQCNGHKAKSCQLGNESETNLHLKSIKNFNYFLNCLSTTSMRPNLLLDESYTILEDYCRATREQPSSIKFKDYDSRSSSNKLEQFLKNVSDISKECTSLISSFKQNMKATTFEKERGCRFSNAILLSTLEQKQLMNSDSGFFSDIVHQTEEIIIGSAKDPLTSEKTTHRLENVSLKSHKPEEIPSISHNQAMRSDSRDVLKPSTHEMNNLKEKVSWVSLPKDSFILIIRTLKMVCSLAKQDSLLVVLRCASDMCNIVQVFKKCEGTCIAYKGRNSCVKFNETLFGVFCQFAEILPQILDMLKHYLTSGSKIICAPLQPVCIFNLISNHKRNKNLIGNKLWYNWHKMMHCKKPIINLFLGGTLTIAELSRLYSYSLFKNNFKNGFHLLRYAGYPNVDKRSELIVPFKFFDIANNVPSSYNAWRTDLLTFLFSKLNPTYKTGQQQYLHLSDTLSTKSTIPINSVVLLIPKPLKCIMNLDFVEENTLVWEIDFSMTEAKEVEQACQQWKSDVENVLFLVIVDLTMMIPESFSPKVQPRFLDISDKIEFKSLPMTKFVQQAEHFLNKPIFYAPVYPRLGKLFSIDDSSIKRENLASQVKGLSQWRKRIPNLKGDLSEWEKELQIFIIMLKAANKINLNKFQFLNCGNIKDSLSAVFSSVFWEQNLDRKPFFYLIVKNQKQWKFHIKFFLRRLLEEGSTKSPGKADGRSKSEENAPIQADTSPNSVANIPKHPDVTPKSVVRQEGYKPERAVVSTHSLPPSSLMPYPNMATNDASESMNLQNQSDHGLADPYTAKHIPINNSCMNLNQRMPLHNAQVPTIDTSLKTNNSFPGPPGIKVKLKHSPQLHFHETEPLFSKLSHISSEPLLLSDADAASKILFNIADIKQHPIIADNKKIVQAVAENFDCETSKEKENSKDERKITDMKKNKKNVDILMESNKKCKEFVNSLTNFQFPTSMETYDSVIFIGKKIVLQQLTNIGLKKKFIYHSIDFMKEDGSELLLLLRKIGSIQPRTLLCLVFSLSVITMIKAVSDVSLQFQCKQAIPIAFLKGSTERLSSRSIISNRVHYVASVVKSLAEHIPTVLLPLVPARVYCNNESAEQWKQKISHAHVVKGPTEAWTWHIVNLKESWIDIMLENHRNRPSLPYIECFVEKDPQFFIIKGNLNDSFCKWEAPNAWMSLVEGILQSIMSGGHISDACSKGSDAVSNSRDIIVESNSVLSDCSNNETTVKIWNYSTTLPKDFLTEFVSAIDSHSICEEKETKEAEYTIFKLSKRNYANLIVGQLHNLRIVDSTLQACILGDKGTGTEGKVD